MGAKLPLQLIKRGHQGNQLTREVDEMLEGDPIDRVVLVGAELVRLGRVDVGAELLVGAEVDVLGPGNDQDNK